MNEADATKPKRKVVHQFELMKMHRLGKYAEVFYFMLNSINHYFLDLSVVLRASCMRKQSLAIFHLSPSAVIMNVC